MGQIQFVNKMAPDYLGPDDRRRISGQTAYDAHLEKKRNVLRQALKREYILKTYNPKVIPEYQVFDTAMLRYQAMQATQGQWFRPTWRNFGKIFFLQVIPMYLIIRWQMNSRDYKPWTFYCSGKWRCPTGGARLP